MLEGVMDHSDSRAVYLLSPGDLPLDVEAPTDRRFDSCP